MDQGYKNTVNAISSRIRDNMDISLTSQQENILKELYQEADTPLDKLPYSSTFDKMYARFLCESQQAILQRDFWILLLKLRKSSNLPRIGKSRKSK